MISALHVAAYILTRQSPLQPTEKGEREIPVAALLDYYTLVDATGQPVTAVE